MKKKTKKFIKGNLWWIVIILVLLGALLILYLKFNFVLQDFFNNSNNSGGGGSTTSYSCTDSDGGLSYYQPGHATDQNNLGYYDDCLDNVMLKEFYCSNNQVTSRNVACPLGYFCYSTRSGGYCLQYAGWKNGDVVDTQAGSGSILGGDYDITNIDLGNLLQEGGNCQLKATIETDWNYANDKCQGIQASEGMSWTLKDSGGTIYHREDLSPTAIGVILDCGVIDENQMTFTAEKIMDLSECLIDYNWRIRFIACNCQ